MTAQSFQNAWNILVPTSATNVNNQGTLGIERFHILKGKTSRLAVTINDLHIPFESKKSVKKVLALLEALQPDDIILNGDILDCYSISKHMKRVERKETLQDEFDQGKAFLAKLRMICPNARIRYTIGNHEARLYTYLNSEAKALAVLNSLKFENLMGLKDVGVELFGTDGFLLNRNYLVLHGDVAAAHNGMSAQKMFAKVNMSGSMGHCHRAGRFVKVCAGGRFEFVENGCLCDLNPEYISGVPNWEHSFLLTEYNRDRFYNRLVRFVDGGFVVDGVRF